MIRPFMLACVVAFLATGCSTLTSVGKVRPDYTAVPEDALTRVAGEIESVVRAGDADQKVTNDGAVIVETPEVQQAIRTRALRMELIHNLLTSRFAVEKPNGLISIERSKAYKDATTRRERDRDALVVMSENDNRWTLYEGIMKASNFPSKSLSAIQDAFHRARIDRMVTGEIHETSDGEIVIVGQ